MTDTTTAIRTLQQNKGRVSEIADVFARYGFASWVAAGVPEAIRGLTSRLAEPELLDMSEGERVRGICVELGTTFIKIAQILSTRRDMVGDEIADALATLQANVPADPPDTVVETITQALGAPPSELFDEFDDVPLGSASIAQVHAARLKDGSEVVLKVQHAGIAERITADLDILEAVAVLLQANDPAMAIYRPVEVVGQLRRSLLAEINFVLEAAHLAQFRANFSAEPDVVIPQPHPELSSERVLTMSRLDGSALSDVITSLGRQQANEFVRRGAQIYIEMIFRDGLFHADPHPGNILILPAPSAAAADPGVEPPAFSVGLLDFGSVGRIAAEQQELIDDLVLSSLQRDLDGLVDVLLRMCDPPHTLDRKALKTDLAGWMDTYATIGAAQMDVSAAGTAAEDIMRKHYLYAPPDFALLMHTMTQLQGMLVESGADVLMKDVLAPYASMIAAKRLDPQRLMRKAQHAARDWGRLADTFPVEVTSILQGIRAGQIEVPLRVEHLDRNVNRLVYAIITAAVFQGSARLWEAQTPPVVGKVSIPGAVGTVVAGGFALRLLAAAKRAGGIG
jgi:ubiquinone biosynthesis protein